MRKFNNYQKVVVLDFLINGDRRDVNARVEGFHAPTNRYMVSVNSVLVYLPEEKLEDFESYWDRHNKKEPQ
jgi:hypothetical protein